MPALEPSDESKRAMKAQRLTEALRARNRELELAIQLKEFSCDDAEAAEMALNDLIESDLVKGLRDFKPQEAATPEGQALKSELRRASETLGKLHDRAGNSRLKTLIWDTRVRVHIAMTRLFSPF